MSGDLTRLCLYIHIICSNHLNGGLKTGQKIMFYGKNVCFSNGPPTHMIRPFENQTKSVLKVICLDGIQMGTVMGIEYLI